ncbi:hypothetical protein IFM89_008200 [Coptis chinensis]|uniref:Uncharacterized protein n=1 Tax=Coptis chinensis TaxID=261450 RepID=A0A835GWM4_9MAGN|nr:hypothetical protein IFM89_008200 [Coptis chinensis]
MEDYQHENPLCTGSNGFHDTFSFSFTFENMVIQEQEQDNDKEQYQDSDFEFNCITPESPSSDPEKSCPADDLFLNGWLQPHAFPFQSSKDNRIDFTRCTSRTSSSSSKDSFAWSRSNSSNSGSSSSSARTSSSEFRGKKPIYTNADTKTTNKRLQNSTTRSGKHQPYVSAQRWQYITPAPVLMSNAELPCRKSSSEPVLVQQEPRTKNQGEKRSRSSWFIVRLFRSIVSACIRCHALEPSVKQDEES